MIAMVQRNIIHIIDIDVMRRAQLARLVFAAGHHAEIYETVEELLAHSPTDGIVMAFDDAAGNFIAGLIGVIMRSGRWLPVIALAEHPSTNRVVRAIKAGAFDYIALPKEIGPLNRTLEHVAQEAELQRVQRMRSIDARRRLERLSLRERQVVHWLVEGSSNKEIARSLEISPRTVEIHRAKLMGKLGVHSASEVVRLSLDAAMFDAALDQAIDSQPSNKPCLARHEQGRTDVRNLQFSHDAPAVHIDRTHAEAQFMRNDLA